MKPTITTDISSQLAELAARAEARDLRQRGFDKSPVNTIQVVLPRSWACALMYGDYSGVWNYEEHEIKSYLAYLEKLHKAHVDCVDVAEGDEFAWRNDVNNLGGPTCIATFSLSPHLGYLAQA